MAGKMQFGTNKLGRQRRKIKCNASTFEGCEWMPNFKGSQRGCVLKVSNEYLNKFGVKKRSQVDSINNIDLSNHGYKKLRKIIQDNIKSNTEFTVTFMTPDLTVKTVEIFFRGRFPSVEFCAEGDGNNFIIENIPYDNSTKKLVDSAELKPGYRVIKVKSTKVTGKKYDEISRMILSASNDMRVDYSVVFEEGDLSWYNFDEPPANTSQLNVKKSKHERKGSGRFGSTKRKSSQNLLAGSGTKNNKSSKKAKHMRGKSSKGNNKKNSSQHSSSMSFDISSVDWTKERDSYKGGPSGNISGNVSDSGNRSPSFSSLASVAEDKFFDKFELDDENKTYVNINTNIKGKKPTLQVIHSGDLAGDPYNNMNIGAIVNDDITQPQPQAQATDNKKKKSVNFKGDKEREITPPPVVVMDVNIMCDLCQKIFTIKDNELQYHSLCENMMKEKEKDAENKTGLIGIEENKKDIKYKHNGLCKNCVKMECTIELSKLNAIMLAPHMNGHSVCICHVDANIHKYMKWIVDEKKNENETEKKTETIKKEKKIKDKNLKISENFIILAINNISVESESFEVIFSMYYEQKEKHKKKIRLKLKKHFTASHLKIVNAYYAQQNKLMQEKRIFEQKRKNELAKKALLTRNTNKTMIDSDPSDSDSISEEEIIIPKKVSNHKRSKSKSRKRKKSVKRIHLSHTSNEYDESDYGAAADENRSVQQLIEENDGMIFIREADKLERDGQWEMASINYEKGINLLEEYQKQLQLSTREKRTYRQELAQYRSKMLLIKNRLIRKSNTPRASKQNNSNKNDEKPDKDKGDDENENKQKEKIDPDQAFKDRLMSDIITEAPNVSFKDVTGLLNVKLALYECIILPQKRPELFTGLRKPTNGLLLFGPPGNGKTMIAKCVATECDATFFSISASSITSKYVGEAERIMRTLFNMAREKQPSIIFIDEIDSLLTARGGANEAESSRRIKTEFLVQFDGVKATADGLDARVLIIGATNLPEQLDEAVLRRFGKRILVPVPDEDARYGILRNLTAKQENNLKEFEFKKIVAKTDLYSASDLTQVCKDAAMGPLRDLGSSILEAAQGIVEVGPIQLKHFEAALKNVRASVKQESLLNYQKWNKQFGSKLTFELSALPTNMHAHVIQPID